MSLCFLKGPLAIPFLWMSIKSVLPRSLLVKIVSVGCIALLCSYKSSNPRYPQIKGKPRNVKLPFSVLQLDLSLQRGNGNTYFSSVTLSEGILRQHAMLLLLVKAFIHRWGLWGFLPFFFSSSFLFFFILYLGSYYSLPWCSKAPQRITAIIIWSSQSIQIACAKSGRINPAGLS